MELASVPVLALLAFICGAAWLCRRIAECLRPGPDDSIWDDDTRLVD
jgi:hypothetical protein